MKQVVTTVGIVATDPQEINGDDRFYVCRFRLASAVRGIDVETGKWVDKHTNWFSVSVFNDLGKNAKSSLQKGDRVIVSGRLRINDWEKEDRSGTSVEITADAVGHDLQWGVSEFTKNETYSNSDLYEEADTQLNSELEESFSADSF